jgi:hypothetical protein
MTLAIARLNVLGENGLGWLNDAGDPHTNTATSMLLLAWTSAGHRAADVVRYALSFQASG